MNVNANLPDLIAEFLNNRFFTKTHMQQNQKKKIEITSKSDIPKLIHPKS